METLRSFFSWPKVFWILIVISLLGCLFLPRDKTVPAENLNVEFYKLLSQVQSNVPAFDPESGQKTIQSRTMVELENGAGRNFRVPIPKPVLGGTQFVKPEIDKDGVWTLVPAK
ncbi:MAG: hypothetical protein ABSA74_01735 [Candidatus Staskawiczbacteria bacterium]|jgi:hypothetical protein